MGIWRDLFGMFKRNTTTMQSLRQDKVLQAENWAIKINDPGIFTFTDDGVTIDLKTGFHMILWKDIERIQAYKADLITMDEICMNITFNNQTVVITEETPGWHIFQQHLAIALPGIPGDWEADVLKVPFEYALTTIYEREDRQLPEATNFYGTIPGVSAEQIVHYMERSGWQFHKPSMKGYTGRNSWSDLVLEKSDNDWLLHGLVAYHPANVTVLRRLMRWFGRGASGEFYDPEGHLLQTIQRGQEAVIPAGLPNAIFNMVHMIKQFEATLTLLYILQDIPYNVAGKAFPRIGEIEMDGVITRYRFHGRGCTFWVGEHEYFYDVDATSKNSIMLSPHGTLVYLEQSAPEEVGRNAGKDLQDYLEVLEDWGVFMERKPGEGTYHVNEVWYEAFRLARPFDLSSKFDTDWL